MAAESNAAREISSERRQVAGGRRVSQRTIDQLQTAEELLADRNGRGR